MKKLQMSEAFFQNLLEKNDSRIEAKIDMILKGKEKEQKTLIAMDFDECAIDEHISKVVTKHYWDRGLVDEELLKDNSVEGIASLFNCYIDLAENEFINQIDSLVKEVHWREGFLQFIDLILSRDDLFPLFISSGLGLAVDSTLRSKNLEHIPVIADDLEVVDGYVKGPYTIVSDSLKGEIVKSVVKKGGFSSTVAVGHSVGDLHLLMAGDKGLRFSFADAPEAMEVADHVIASWEEITEYL